MKHVVVVQTAFLGDLLLSLPLFKHIKKIWPQCEISLVCREGLGVFFKETGVVDHIYEIKKGDSKSYRKNSQKLNQRKIDLVLAPHMSFRTALFCKSLNSSCRISFKKVWNSFFYTDLVAWPKRLPEALRQLSLLVGFDAELRTQILSYMQNEKPNAKSSKNQLSAVPSWASMSLKETLGTDKFKNSLDVFGPEIKSVLNSKKTILIFPGSVWETKKWTADGFLQIAELLQEKGYSVFWMGGGAEISLAEDLARRLPGSFVLAGKTSVLQSCLLMLQSQLVICNDSASSHMAAAAEVPVLSIFGPTVLDFGYRPWSNQAYVIEKEGLACRPCGKHGGHRCPIKTHDCMTHISAIEVFNQVKTILQ